MGTEVKNLESVSHSLFQLSSYFIFESSVVHHYIILLNTQWIGVHADYEGGRDSADIVLWLRKKIGQPSVEVKDSAEISALTKVLWHVNVYACMYVCMYGCMYVFMHGWMYVCIIFLCMHDKSSLKSYQNRSTVQSSTHHHTVTMQNDAAVALGVFTDANSAEYTAFIAAATIGNIPFAHTFNLAIALERNLGAPAVVILKQVRMTSLQC